MASRKEVEPREAPPYVFRGTVKKLRAATMKDVPVGERTAVVHVDEVLEAPKSFAHYGGQDITVELAGKGKIAAGEQWLFRADSWIFGEGVAVRAVSQARVPATRGVTAAAMRASGDPVAARAVRKMDDHIDDADLIVTGRVTAVTLPPQMPEPAMRAAGVQATRPVSEHDPKWRQAVIQVDEMHKGRHDSGEVTVLFPSSTDVRWYRAPKFHAGQKGLFMLHKTPIETEEHHALRALALNAPSPVVDVYTALHPEDVHPITQEEPIKANIRSRAAGRTAEEDSTWPRDDRGTARLARSARRPRKTRA